MPSRRPSTVALYSPGWPAGRVPNGLVTYSAALRDALSALGVQVFLLVRKLVGDPETSDIIDLEAVQTRLSVKDRISRKVDTALGCGWRAGVPIVPALAHELGRLVREEGLEVFQMEESFGLVHEVRRRIGIPTVVRLAGPWFLSGEGLGLRQDWRFRLRVRKEGIALKHAAAIVSPSQDVLDRTRAHYGYPFAQASVVAIPVRAPASWERWDLAKCDRDAILFVGRFDRLKGADLILQAFKQVMAHRPQTKLRFVGPDRGLITEEGSVIGIERYLERLFPEPRERQRIEWLGQQDHERIARLRTQHLITVVASRYETLCNSAIEALRIGSPVIASDAGGLGELIEDGWNALSFQTGNPGDLAAKILELLGDPESAAQLGKRAAERCLQRYAPEQVGEQHLDLYAKAMAAS